MMMLMCVYLSCMKTIKPIDNPYLLYGVDGMMYYYLHVHLN